jgi:hypothetical protein
MLKDLNLVHVFPQFFTPTFNNQPAVVTDIITPHTDIPATGANAEIYNGIENLIPSTATVKTRKLLDFKLSNVSYLQVSLKI